MSHFWGYHTLLDVRGCKIEKVIDPEFLTAWVKSLVKDIAMVPFGEPQVVHFGHNDPLLSGWTVIQLIETSNIVAYFCDETGDAYIDVFSCSLYDMRVIVESINKNFSPINVRVNYLTRNAG